MLQELRRVKQVCSATLCLEVYEGSCWRVKVVIARDSLVLMTGNCIGSLQNLLRGGSECPTKP